jgi:15-cis-phytoene synthase
VTLAACAAIVHRADPDRFLATMAASVPDRARLFPLFAFNVEVARAPWVTTEPLIAQMRLQWWQDAVEEIAAGKTPRQHEVVGPLAEAMKILPLAPFKALIAARQWDIYDEPFPDDATFIAHMEDTSGGLMWLACGATGPEPMIRGVGVAQGIASWLTAAPELAARGRMPLVDDSDEALQGLAQRGLDLLHAAKSVDFGVSVPALRTAWRTKALLKQVLRDPSRVAAGTLGTSEFQRRSSLMVRAFTGRW